MKWTFAISLGLRDDTVESDKAQVEAALAVPWFDGLYVKVPHRHDIDGGLWGNETWLAIVEMLKDSRKAIVFGQNLWASWHTGTGNRIDLLIPDYYGYALETLHHNADLLSYHLSRPVGTLLDLEPYGAHPFNYRKNSQGEMVGDERFQYGFSPQVRRAIRAAIKEATIDQTATDAAEVLHLAQAENFAEQILLGTGSVEERNTRALKVRDDAFTHVMGMQPVRRVPLADHCWPADSSHPGHYSYQLRGLAERGLSYKTYHETKASEVWLPSRPDPYPDRTVWMCYLYPTEDARGERRGKQLYAMTVDRFYAMDWKNDVMEYGKEPPGVWSPLEEINIHGHGADFRVAMCAEFKERGQPSL